MTMTQVGRPALSVRRGEVAPATYGVTYDNSFHSFEAQAGRPAIVILLGRLPLAENLPLLTEFGSRLADLAAFESDVVALVDMQGARAREYAALAPEGLKVLFCEPDVFTRWGFGGFDPAAVAIDRGLRVAAILDALDPSAATRAALDCVAAQPREAARDVVLPAPVLAIPNIFTREYCRELIARFETGDHRFGGMAAIDANGNAFHKVDEGKKHRRDFVLGPRDPYLGGVMTGVIRSVLPEIKKAFQVDACHTDRFLVARYDETGGYFKRHRDNAAPAVAFRQFALSVNLNDDYEGGHILFPEYNSHRYRPGAGSGVVFSCSLLHEAAAVTKGRRYVLLTFLHDSAAQAKWLATTRQG